MSETPVATPTDEERAVALKHACVTCGAPEGASCRSMDYAASRPRFMRASYTTTTAIHAARLAAAAPNRKA